MSLIYTIRIIHPVKLSFSKQGFEATNLILKLLKVYHIVLSHKIESYDIITENAFEKHCI